MSPQALSDNAHLAYNRELKATALANVLWALLNDGCTDELPSEIVTEFTDEAWERARLVAGVKPATGQTEGVSRETRARVVMLLQDRERLEQWSAP